MRALVVYESMFGNTRILAESVAGVLDRSGMETTVATAASAPHSTAGYRLVIVGAPTHAHSLPRPSSRIEAAEWAAETRRALMLEPSANAAGVREWLKNLAIVEPVPSFAAFSTRVDMARILSGDAANAIAKRLRSLKVDHVEAECFLVSPSSRLLDGEQDRAEEWAASLPMLVGVATNATSSAPSNESLR